ncbi:MAG: BatA and WFA domain-containing protein, partial [Planctomycetota bacterium]|nr:BatA and WFA domain-containing protein [Planctomycetota bacterium]
MALLAPLMLVGLAALALPVLIHLLDRTRTVLVDWPTLRFLKVARKESANRARLKHLLVFLARCLLVILVVLAMAKPYRRTESWAPPPALPQTLVVVIDNSYSMGYREGGTDRTRFERAKAMAVEQIGALAIEDEVAVILANDTTATLIDRPTRDHAQAQKIVRAAKLSTRTTDLGPAVLQAFALGQLDAPPPATGTTGEGAKPYDASSGDSVAKPAEESSADAAPAADGDSPATTQPDKKGAGPPGKT